MEVLGLGLMEVGKRQLGTWVGSTTPSHHHPIPPADCTNLKLNFPLQSQKQAKGNYPCCVVAVVAYHQGMYTREWYVHACLNSCVHACGCIFMHAYR